LHILVVEDDDFVADAIQSGLAVFGIQSEWVNSAATAMAAIQNGPFDAVILDIGLPDTNGLELLALWRQNGISLPVLILTARDAIPEKVTGLRAGADDYLTKPFDLNELVARLEALLRRTNVDNSDRLRVGKLSCDPRSAEVWIEDKLISLSRREYILLEALMRHPGQLLTSQQLEDRLYGWNEGVESNAVAVHIHHLRRKIGQDLIETLRGLGYRLRKQT
jgi:two-component system response regulator QseB